MIDTPATFIGIAGAAFLLATYAPSALASRTAQHTAPAVAIPAQHGKADQVTPRRPQARIPVTTVEIVGVAQTSIILRDRAGNVLYRSDPVTNTTILARDADLPVVTVKQDQHSPEIQQPASQREGNDRPDVGKRKGPPVGCESVVSALVGRDVNRAPGLCLAQAQTQTQSSL